jgi:metal-responsive CopG/Arc/MetJ family transcriptional regulator
METISVDLPDDLEAELESYAEAENIGKSAAVRKLVAERLDDWRTKQALERLEAGEVTLSRAAEIAEMNVWEFAARANDESVTWVSDDHLETDLEDL